MKAQSGGDILAWGGAAFLQALVRTRLVDELRLVINPVALGAGLPLFKGLAAPVELELVEAAAYACSQALHIYRPIGADGGEGLASASGGGA